jgi:ribosomal protection tetracycline resistance protein
VHRFRLELPADLLGPVLPTLSRRGRSHWPQHHGGALAVVEGGEVPAARVHTLMTQLPGLTRGDGVLETSFDHYEKARGEPPRRGSGR